MQAEGYPHPCNGAGGVERAERSGGLHKRSAEDWGSGLRARGAEPLSKPGRCFTKQTGDMVYTMAENSWLSQLWLDA